MARRAYDDERDERKPTKTNMPRSPLHTYMVAERARLPTEDPVKDQEQVRQRSARQDAEGAEDCGGTSGAT